VSVERRGRWWLTSWASERSTLTSSRDAGSPCSNALASASTSPRRLAARRFQLDYLFLDKNERGMRGSQSTQTTQIAEVAARSRGVVVDGVVGVVRAVELEAEVAALGGPAYGAEEGVDQHLCMQRTTAPVNRGPQLRHPESAQLTRALPN
jgi:hypothetical protein